MHTTAIPPISRRVRQQRLRAATTVNPDLPICSGGVSCCRCCSEIEAVSKRNGIPTQEQHPLMANPVHVADAHTQHPSWHRTFHHVPQESTICRHHSGSVAKSQRHGWILAEGSSTGLAQTPADSGKPQAVY